jgi:hypothetical protein
LVLCTTERELCGMDGIHARLLALLEAEVNSENTATTPERLLFLSGALLVLRGAAGRPAVARPPRALAPAAQPTAAAVQHVGLLGALAVPAALSGAYSLVLLLSCLRMYPPPPALPPLPAPPPQTFRDVAAAPPAPAAPANPWTAVYAAAVAVRVGAPGGAPAALTACAPTRSRRARAWTLARKFPRCFAAPTRPNSSTRLAATRSRYPPRTLVTARFAARPSHSGRSTRAAHCFLRPSGATPRFLWGSFAAPGRPAFCRGFSRALWEPRLATQTAGTSRACGASTSEFCAPAPRCPRTLAPPAIC